MLVIQEMRCSIIPERFIFPLKRWIVPRNKKLMDWINYDEITYYKLSWNPAAISLITENLDEINWISLSRNPAAIPLLEKYPEKIDWSFLSQNPADIHLLEKDLIKIRWYWLSRNPGAIPLLEKNSKKLTGGIYPRIQLLFIYSKSILKKLFGTCYP